MPQMLAIQPAVPKAPPQAPATGSPDNKEQNNFSPHLEKALSNKKQQQAAQDKNHKDTSSSTDKNSLTDATSSPTDKTSSADDNSQALKPEKAETTTDSAANAPAKEHLEQTYSVASANTEKPLLIMANSALSGSRQIEAAATLLQNASAELGNEPNKSGENSEKTLLPFTITPEPPSTITNPVVMNTMKPLAATGQDSLINQLQSIIDNSNETGTVSITKVGNSAIPNSINSNIHGLAATSLSNTTEPVIVATTPENPELNLNGILIANLDGVEKATSKPLQQLHGIRNDAQQQYFNAKNTTQNLAENSQNSQENKNGDNLSKQTTNFSQPSGLLGTEQLTNTFSQISVATQQTTPQPTNDSTPPILLPSGTIVHEEDVIQQLTERFQVSSKHMDSRINLKLHPAELGELKIDLTVKDGSIRANIVAQSQHALDILHKNIPKLKTLLENQGFNIDQISVTTESESVGGFDLFDQQLFSQDGYIPTAQKGHRETEATFILANNENSAPTTSSGVNVKI
jgi:flagellar hook-length control protein FliK